MIHSYCLGNQWRVYIAKDICNLVEDIVILAKMVKNICFAYRRRSANVLGRIARQTLTFVSLTVIINEISLLFFFLNKKREFDNESMELLQEVDYESKLEMDS